MIPSQIQALIERMRSQQPRWRAAANSAIDVVDAALVDTWADELEAAILDREAQTTNPPDH